MVLLCGCFTGHLMALGRRREYVREIRAAYVTADGGALLRCTTQVTDDDGRETGLAERWIVLSANGQPLGSSGRATPIGPPLAPCPPAEGVADARCVAIDVDASEGRLRLRGGGRDVDLPFRRLTVVRVEPWVYPLLPVAAVVDVLSVPLFVTTGPMIVLVGD